MRRKQEAPAQPRPLHSIAREILSDWTSIDYAAKPYVRAMLALTSMRDFYGLDSADYVVLYFLNNAGKWRGETARRIKAELKQMCKQTERESEK